MTNMLSIHDKGARVVVVSSVAHTFSKTPINLDDLTFKKNFKSIHAYAQSKVRFRRDICRKLWTCCQT